MDTKALDEYLIALAEKRMELNRLNYSDKSYDKVEEELHEIEDDFIDKFGDDFEKILEEVHKEHCADADILSPIAYLANEYAIKGKKEDGSPKFVIKNYKQGLLVETKEEEAGRLVILPNPPRILLFTNEGTKVDEVWKA